MGKKLNHRFNNLIFEIGTEEIPARFVPEMLDDLKEKSAKGLAELKLNYASLLTLGTPRRLVLYVENLAGQQADETVEAKGPPKEFAFDPNGNPTKAALGFAHKNGVNVSALTIKEFDGKEYVVVEYQKKGQMTAELLKNFLPGLVSSLYLPIAMRWGAESFKFIRPLHWFLAAYGGEIVKFELAGVTSANAVAGHRFVSGGGGAGGQGAGFKRAPTAALQDIKKYKAYLKKLGVVLDQEERKSIIIAGVKNAIRSKTLKPVIDHHLLSEVTYLVEYPSFVVGNFSAAFLKVPNEVLVSTMKKNQKYFPVVDERGRLTNCFVAVTNCKVGKNLKDLKEGNERVLSARLSDARYFFEEDQRVTLETRVKDLDKIAYHNGLGTLLEKKDRLVDLVKYLGKVLKMDEAVVDRAARVATLCKADLTSKMVFEFTDLQGVMGREYALLSGEDKTVAEGIFEHYLPRFAGDLLPKTAEGTLVALADKFDTLVGCFSLGVYPTGSADPFGLRRVATGIVSIVLEKKLDLILAEVLERNYRLFAKIHQEFKKGKREIKPAAEVLGKVLQFLAERLRNALKEAGVRYDLIEAALCDFNDISAAYTKALVLQRHAQSPWLRGLIESADRIQRLAKGAPRENVLEHDLAEAAEKEMYAAYLKVNFAVGEKVEKDEYEAALLELAHFTPVVEKFFADVLVMHADERIRTNRLALLCSLKKMYFEFGDFSKIVIN